MSQSEIVRFPKSPIPAHENNPDAAKLARRRIAGLGSSPYLSHAAPAKEDLVGAVHPVSPAAESAHNKTPATPHAPFILNSSDQPVDQPEQQLPATAAGSQASAAQLNDDLLPPSRGTQAQPSQMQARPIAAQPVPTIAAANPLEQLAAPDPKKTASPSRSRAAAEPKSLPSRFMPLLVGVITFALVLLAVKAPILLNQISYLTNGKPAAETPPPKASAVVVAPDPVISIPKINVIAPVIYTDNNAESIIQKHLESGVVHYAGTAEPGTNGNSVIFGHSSNDWWEPGNYKFVFVLLDKLALNDTFTVNYHSKQYVYQVTGSKVVPPTDLSVLSPTAEPTMTLITCTPPGTSWQRLVVTAKQISPEPGSEVAQGEDPSAQAAKDGTLPGNAPGIGQRISKWWQDLTKTFTRGQ